MRGAKASLSANGHQRARQAERRGRLPEAVHLPLHDARRLGVRQHPVLRDWRLRGCVRACAKPASRATGRASGCASTRKAGQARGGSASAPRKSRGGAIGLRPQRKGGAPAACRRTACRGRAASAYTPPRTPPSRGPGCSVTQRGELQPTRATCALFALRRRRGAARTTHLCSGRTSMTSLQNCRPKTTHKPPMKACLEENVSDAPRRRGRAEHAP